LNDAVLLGNDVVITCESTVTGSERIQFLEYQTNPSGAIISDGNALLPGHPNYFRHSLQADVDGGIYALAIKTTVLADGGKYACRDVNALPSPMIWYADLVVIGTFLVFCVLCFVVRQPMRDDSCVMRVSVLTCSTVLTKITTKMSSRMRSSKKR
jgi:hypothetical protein